MYNEGDKYCYRNRTNWNENIDYDASECYTNVTIHTAHLENYIHSDIAYIVEGVVLPIIAIIGIIGNICGILYFGRNRHQTYYALLCFLAISDLVTIASFVLLYCVPIAFDPTTALESSLFASTYITSYAILYFSQLTGIYLTISLCFERYHAICRPLNHRVQRKPAYMYIVPVVTVAFIYNLPVFFELSIKSENLEKWKSNDTHIELIGNATIYMIQPTSLYNNSIYQQIYRTGLKLLFKCIVPYISLISLNAMILKTLSSIRYVESDKDRRNGIKDKEQSNERIRTLTMSSDNETDCLHIHLSDKEQYMRQSQVDLAIVNFAIAVMFLISYSLIWVWAIHDFVLYLSPKTETVVSK